MVGISPYHKMQQATNNHTRTDEKMTKLIALVCGMLMIPFIVHPSASFVVVGVALGIALAMFSGLALLEWMEGIDEEERQMFFERNQ